MMNERGPFSTEKMYERIRSDFEDDVVIEPLRVGNTTGGPYPYSTKDRTQVQDLKLALFLAMARTYVSGCPKCLVKYFTSSSTSSSYSSVRDIDETKNLSHHLRDRFFVVVDKCDDDTNNNNNNTVVPDQCDDTVTSSKEKDEKQEQHQQHYHDAATLLQSIFRQRHHQVIFQKQQRSVILVQSVVRQRFARQQLQKMRKSLLRVTRERLEEERRQRLNRENMLMEKERILQEMKLREQQHAEKLRRIQSEERKKRVSLVEQHREELSRRLKEESRLVKEMKERFSSPRTPSFAIDHGQGLPLNNNSNTNQFVKRSWLRKLRKTGMESGASSWTDLTLWKHVELRLTKFKLTYAYDKTTLFFQRREIARTLFLSNLLSCHSNGLHFTIVRVLSILISFSVPYTHTHTHTRHRYPKTLDKV